MGKRGPLSKSDALKAQSGTFPLTAEVVGQLTAPVKSPKPPRHFSKEERAVWRVTIKLLEETHTIDERDQAIVAAYCDAYVKWQKVEKRLKEIEKERNVDAAFLTLGANGNLVTNPLLTISRKAQSDMVGYAAQLGMTPAARIRIHVVPAKPAGNKFSQLKKMK